MPAELSPLYADFSLTEQALANLLLNAAVHTHRRHRHHGHRRHRARRRAGVSRGGRPRPGIAAAERERIFRKFARGGGARAGGLGLGLSIVQGFVAAQGGTVAYRDNPGGGAVFTIYLPHRIPQGAPTP
jgi:two-component system sensor histidine kinase KdpD